MIKRNTWQREAVRKALGTSEAFVSAQALHAHLRDAGSATVGEADSLQQEGESLYRACTPGSHHHHLICRSCGLTIEIAAHAVETWAQKIAAEYGFIEANHVVDVFGTCAGCYVKA